MVLKNIHRILIIKFRGMGDLLASTPVIISLRRAFPNAYIAYLTATEYREAVEGNPYLDEVILFDRTGIKALPPLQKFMRQNCFIQGLRRRQFDLVIDLFGNPRSALFTFFSGARYRLGYAYRVRRFAYNVAVKPVNPQYVVEFNLDAVRALGIEPAGIDLCVPIDDGDRSFAQCYLSDQGIQPSDVVVGLFPGGSWPAKRWTEVGFAQLADMIQEELKAKAIFLGGSKERESISRIVKLMRTQPLVATNLPLRKFAAVVERLNLFVGNDAGPKYVAVAVKTPTITLFGPTDAENAQPPQSEHVALMAGLPCQPCNKHTCPDMACMKSITAEAVMTEVQRILALSEI